MTDHEKRVEELVDLLGCSIVEAEDIILADKKIDRNEAVDFGLSKEDEKRLSNMRMLKSIRNLRFINLTREKRKPTPQKRV